jgi:hypothetical protein
MYGDFCISVTTKINPKRYMKNIMGCGRQKLSDSYTKYYSPIKHLTFEITVLCKDRDIFTQYALKNQKRFVITYCNDYKCRSQTMYGHLITRVI